MGISVGITSETAQRALTCNLDRKHGRFTGQNPAPGAQDFSRSNAWTRASCGHVLMMQARAREGASCLESCLFSIISIDSQLSVVWNRSFLFASESLDQACAEQNPGA